MHKKIPKICTGCRVSAAKIYLYHSTKIAKARPHSEEWQTDTSVQKQWSMNNLTTISVVVGVSTESELLKLKPCSLYHENLLLQKFNDMYTQVLA